MGAAVRYQSSYLSENTVLPYFSDSQDLSKSSKNVWLCIILFGETLFKRTNAPWLQDSFPVCSFEKHRCFAFLSLPASQQKSKLFRIICRRLSSRGCCEKRSNIYFWIRVVFLLWEDTLLCFYRISSWAVFSPFRFYETRACEILCFTVERVEFQCDLLFRRLPFIPRVRACI